MKYVEIIADPGSLDTLKAIAEKARAADLRTAPPGEDGMQQTRMLIADDRLQSLLPPAATLRLMLGNQEVALAQGAGLLLAINIVCVNLATKLVFLVKRISPRAWREKERARRGMTIYIIGWVLMLALLAGVIYLRRVLPG